MQTTPPTTPPIIAPVCLGLDAGTRLVVGVEVGLTVVPDVPVGLVLELPVGSDGGLHAVFTI
jgi:hypothetical protein